MSFETLSLRQKYSVQTRHMLMYINNWKVTGYLPSYHSLPADIGTVKIAGRLMALLEKSRVALLKC